MADILVWGAYIAIPIVLLFYARRRKNLPFKHLFWLFGLFIAACGTTHLMAYITTISPVYRLDGLIKLITAVSSWGTVAALAVIAPKALSMRMPEEYERELEEKEKAQQDLAVLNTILQERTNQLEAANSELEGFTYMISHDLRSPLRSIVGNSRIVLEDAPEAIDETSRVHLERLASSALKMASLVDDLLEFSRLGRHEPVRIDVDAGALASGIAEELKGEYDVSFHIEPNLHVMADPQLLRIVLYNLMQNACKYSDPYKGAAVEVGQTTTENGKAIFVRDNGIGFDMAYESKLFQPFERLHRNDIPGTGIGLANVKRIVDRHGGSIWADSQLGTGSVFYFTLEPKSE